MEQNNSVKHEIFDIAAKRKSIRAFSNKELTAEQVAQLFEAARWSFSSANEQPWRYVYATRNNSNWYDAMLSCLNESNQVWVKKAPLIIACIAKTTNHKNGSHNAKAQHDLGAANMLLALQATYMGMQAHPMGGYKADIAHTVLNLPAEHELVCFMAVGYPGADTDLPEQQQAAEHTRSKRAEQDDFVKDKPFVPLTVEEKVMAN